MAPGAPLPPSVIAVSAAISACEKGDQWESALFLLAEMQLQRLWLGCSQWCYDFMVDFLGLRKKSCGHVHVENDVEDMEKNGRYSCFFVAFWMYGVASFSWLFYCIFEICGGYPCVGYSCVGYSTPWWVIFGVCIDVTQNHLVLPLGWTEIRRYVETSWYPSISLHHQVRFRLPIVVEVWCILPLSVGVSFFHPDMGCKLLGEHGVASIFGQP